MERRWVVVLVKVWELKRQTDEDRRRVGERRAYLKRLCLQREQGVRLFRGLLHSVAVKLTDL